MIVWETLHKEFLVCVAVSLLEILHAKTSECYGFFFVGHKHQELEIVARHKSLTAPKTLSAPPCPLTLYPRLGLSAYCTYTSYSVHQDRDRACLDGIQTD